MLLLVPEEKPAGHLARPAAEEGLEPGLKLVVVPAGGLVEEQPEVVQEQLVVQKQPHRRRIVISETESMVSWILRNLSKRSSLERGGGDTLRDYY